MKKNMGMILVFALAGLIVLFGIVAAAYNFLTKAELSVIELLGNGTVWALTGIAILGLFLWWLITYKPDLGKRVKKINQLEDSKFMTWSEMKENETLTVTKFSELSEVKDGIPVYAEATRNKKDVNIVLAKPIHTKVIGTTGSGKTTTFVDPILQILPRTKTKPSLVITDPKGELYKHHADLLRKQGYKIYLIDLKDIYRSVRWNPFHEVIRRTQLLNNPGEIENVKGKYYFQGIEFLTEKDAKNERDVFSQELNDKIFEDLQDIIYTVCPVESKGDGKSWEEGARGFILSVVLAFWEDMRDGLMQPHQFNLFNVFQNICMYSNEEFTEFRAYFENREKFSKAKGRSRTVAVSTDRTLTSYLGNVNQYVEWLTDEGIAAFTAENDINISGFDEEPSVLFLKIPDERENRHRLITLFVTQMYKTLVEKAGNNLKNGKTEEEELMRNVYFVMDEFGNMPTFNSLDRIITVGRSRKVFLIPVIQDYAQLENKYSKEVAGIVKSNTNITIFIGSTDKSTINEISELCGKTKSANISFSEQTNTGSISMSAAERPLIYPTELQTLNDPPRMGNAIVLGFGKNPIRAKFTPPFSLPKIYGLGSSTAARRAVELFDKEHYFYDIVIRNSFIEEAKALEEKSAEEFKKFLEDQQRDNTDDEGPKNIDPAEAPKQKIKQKLKAFEGRITDECMTLLLEATLEELPSVIGSILELIEANPESYDNHLEFELTLIRNTANDIIYTIKKINEETKGEERI